MNGKTLTEEQCSKLSLYILMTTKTREGEAELKECIERTKQMHTDIEKVHKEMWSAVKDRNEDAFAALSQEFERSSRILAEEWAQTSALAKIAVISESND